MFDAFVTRFAPLLGADSRADRASSPWPDQLLRDELGTWVAAELGSTEGTLLFEEGSFPKCGTKSVGVARQYLRGKQEVGLGDYEVQGWRGWHHHQTLAFLALQQPEGYCGTGRGPT